MEHVSNDMVYFYILVEVVATWLGGLFCDWIYIDRVAKEQKLQFKFAHLKLKTCVLYKKKNVFYILGTYLIVALCANERAINNELFPRNVQEIIFKRRPENSELILPK